MILDHIAEYLDDKSAVFTRLSGTGGNLVKGVMPDTDPAPDTMVALYETAGLGTLMTFSTGAQAGRQITIHGLQVLSRSTSLATAMTRAEVAFGLLDGYSGPLPDSTSATVYPSIAAVAPPFMAGRDGNERFLVSTNYLVWRVV